MIGLSKFVTGAIDFMVAMYFTAPYARPYTGNHSILGTGLGYLVDAEVTCKNAKRLSWLV